MKHVLEVLIILTTIGSWARMYRQGEGGLLSRKGLESLKYYTTLSNIFAGLVSIVMLIALLFGGVPGWLGFLKLASAVTVTVTFLVTLFFLVPQMGFAGLYKGELMCLHAVGPVLTVFAFFMSGDIPEMKPSAAFLATVPTIIYGAFYAGNIMKNGIGEGENTNDWYGFAAAGVKTIPLVYVVIVALTWGLALVMLKLKF